MGTTNHGAVNPRSRLPGAEVPMFEGNAQLRAGSQVEFDQDIPQVSFDGFGGDMQFYADFLVGVTQTDQCRYIAFTGG